MGRRRCCEKAGVRIKWCGDEGRRRKRAFTNRLQQSGSGDDPLTQVWLCAPQARATSIGTGSRIRANKDWGMTSQAPTGLFSFALDHCFSVFVHLRPLKLYGKCIPKRLTTDQRHCAGLPFYFWSFKRTISSTPPAPPSAISAKSLEQIAFPDNVGCSLVSRGQARACRVCEKSLRH